MSCLEPLLTLPETNVTFSVNQLTSISYTLVYTALGRCSPPGTLTCTIAVNASGGLAVSSATTIQVPSTATPGMYTGSVSCSETNGSSTTIPFNAFVIKPTILSLSQTYIPTVPDCTPTKLNSSVLNITSDGGVLPWMIRFDAKSSSDSDNLLRVPSLTDLPYNFTYQDIISSYVSVNPSLITNVGTSRLARIPVTLTEPSGTFQVSSFLSVNVSHSFCPALTQPSDSLYKVRSNSSQPAVISSSALPLAESHGLSVGEFLWNVPTLPANTGSLEFYCPDAWCLGPGWVAMPLTLNSIPQSWITMGGFRWNPKGYNGADFNVTFLSYSNDITGSTLSAVVTFNVTVNGTVPSVPLPYSKITSGSCTTYETGRSSATTLNPSYPFGPFSSNSPVRPLCAAVTLPAVTVVNIGDWGFSAPVTTLLTVSGYISLGPATNFPGGFTPLTFYSNDYSSGTVNSAIEIRGVSDDGLLTITTSQVSYPPARSIQSRSQLSVMKFDSKTGRMTHITPSRWIQSATSSPIQVMTVTVQGSGIYVFGSYAPDQNSSAASLTPVSMYLWNDYLGAWGMRNYSFNDQLTVAVTYNSDTQFAAQPIPLITSWSTETHLILYGTYVGTTATSDPLPQLNLRYFETTVSNDTLWAFRLNDESPSGFTWRLLTNTTYYTYRSGNISYGVVNVTVTRPGFYAVMKPSSVILSGGSSWHVIRPIYVWFEVFLIFIIQVFVF